jgi:hypothetical protein
MTMLKRKYQCEQTSTIFMSYAMLFSIRINNNALDLRISKLSQLLYQPLSINLQTDLSINKLTFCKFTDSP